MTRTERLASMFMNDDGFKCPHCEHWHRLDSETASSVVSYWGEDVHDFTCSRCDKDFIVKERVTRKFETAANYDDLD